MIQNNQDIVEIGLNMLYKSYSRYFLNKTSLDNHLKNYKRLSNMVKSNREISDSDNIEILRKYFSNGVNRVELIFVKFKLDTNSYILFSTLEAVLLTKDINNNPNLIHLGDISGLTPIRRTETRKTEFINNIFKSVSIYYNTQKTSNKKKQDVEIYRELVSKLFNARTVI